MSEVDMLTYGLGGLVAVAGTWGVLYKPYQVFVASRRQSTATQIEAANIPISASIDRLEETLVGFGKQIEDRFDHHEELMAEQHKAINKRMDSHQANITVLFERTEAQGNRITAVETLQRSSR